jgi:methionyl aminopeptidase
MIQIKSPEEIEIMAEAGHRLGKILYAVSREVRPGISTKALDLMAEELIRANGCTPAFLGYAPYGAVRPYPATLCASVNGVVVHGLPGDYTLREGDIIGLDLGLIYKGFYSDTAVSVGVGKISKEAKQLIAATEEAMYAGIKEAKPGNTLGDIGFAISRIIKKRKLKVVEGLTGHGIGRGLHEDPYVLNVGRSGEGEALKEGMVIAIEPMVAIGTSKVKQGSDDSFFTADGSLAAHFEHTVAITKNGPKILTKV